MLYQKLELDAFWTARLPPSRKGTRWDHVLQTLVSYRLIGPGSEWRLHREWFDKSAMADLLGADYRLAADDTLYRCLDQIVEHKVALFAHLQQRWKDLFGVQFDVLLYDLTSTYFESDPPFAPGDKRRYGYSRDKRFDCVQVVIALIVTPEGFPLGYEVLPGNTLDHQTLRSALEGIEQQYGKARRVWVMDRGIPTEETLAHMRQSDPPLSYLVGTPKGRLSKLEAQLAERPWQKVRGRNHGQTLAATGGMLRFCPKRFAHRQRAGDATAATQTLVAAAGRVALQMKHLSRDGLLMKLGGSPATMARRLAFGRHPRSQKGRAN